jgi:hypothetical protein
MNTLAYKTRDYLECEHINKLFFQTYACVNIIQETHRKSLYLCEKCDKEYNKLLKNYTSVMYPINQD